MDFYGFDVRIAIKKPVKIEFINQNVENLREEIEFTGKHHKFDEWFSSFKEYREHVNRDGGIFKIFTLEGCMEASIGDYIIRGVKGEHYPCKPDIFKLTYDVIEQFYIQLFDGKEAKHKKLNTINPRCRY